MISSAKSSAQSSSLSSVGQDGKKKLGKAKIEELMKSIRDDFELHSKLSKFYYTKIGEKHGMTVPTFSVDVGKNKSKVKKFEKIANKDKDMFKFDPLTNKLTYNGNVTLDEQLLKNHKKYSELRIDNISAIIRNASSKSAQMNSGDKLTDAGLDFINAALFNQSTAITEDEVRNFLAKNGFGEEAIEVGIARWFDLVNAISLNLNADWSQLDQSGVLGQMLNGVMTSTFLQGLIHLYKNIRLVKTDNDKYNVDSVFQILSSSFEAVDAKRKSKLEQISASVGGSQDALNKLFQYADVYNRPSFTEYQLGEIAKQPNKTKQKDLETKYKKSIRDGILRSVKSEFGAYASLDDKKLGSFLKSLDNFPSRGQFNNNTLLSISRSMVDSKLTNQALKPVTGEEHNVRKELLKQNVSTLDPYVKQTGVGSQETLELASQLAQQGQYAVAIKLINYYISVKYKLFKALKDEFLPKKATRKKVTQSSMSIVFGD